MIFRPVPRVGRTALSWNSRQSQGPHPESDEKSQKEYDRPWADGEKVPLHRAPGPSQAGSHSGSPLPSMWVLAALSARWLPEGMIY